MRSLLLISCLAFTTAAHAVELGEGRLVINGLGGAAYAVTGHNDIQGASLQATPAGELRNLEFNLSFLARITPQITVSSQLFFDEIGGPEAGVDWTFLELRLANWLKIRGGKVKLPFGISSEVQSVGTLRPFYSLPETVYGPTAVSSEAYYGAGLTGELLSGPGWTLEYDVYAGETSLQTVEPFFLLGKPLLPGESTTIDPDVVKNLFGGRLVLGTPIEGLSLRASAYRGTIGQSAGEQQATLFVAMLSAEYSVDRWLVRAEVFRTTEETVNHGGYLEVARFLTPQVQLAAQLQYMRTHAHGVPDDSSLLWHASYAVGLNYWFSPNMVVKAAASLIRGNRLAFPTQLDDAIKAGNLSEETPFFTLGTQFTF